MKPVRLGDLRELLQGPAFSAWWSEYARSAAALRDARLREGELASLAEAMAARSTRARRAAAGAARRDAARLATEAEERRARAALLSARAGAAEREQAEARARTAALLARAAADFGCTPGERFLYWRRPGAGRSAWAVALADAAAPGMRVEALGIYAVQAGRDGPSIAPAATPTGRRVAPARPSAMPARRSQGRK